jgi:hypothetical protein
MSLPISQRVVSFHGDELIGVQAEDGTVFAPFNRLCENLGLQRAGQAQRIQHHRQLGGIDVDHAAAPRWVSSWS